MKDKADFDICGRCDHPHILIPEIAKEIGFEQTIALQHIHYWLQKRGRLIDDNLWIRNTFEEWGKQLSYWSISKIKRIFYSLEEQGLIFSKKMNVNKSDHTKWYSINYETLTSLLNTSCKKEDKQERNLDHFAINDRLPQKAAIINNNSNTSSQDNIFLFTEVVSNLVERITYDQN